MKLYYEHAGIVIYHGDNRKIAPLLGEFDLLLTDPPYGIGMAGGVGFGGFDGFGKGVKRTPRKYTDKGWDDKRPARWQLEMMIATASNAIIWGGNFFADILPPSTHWIIWDKQQTMPTFSDFEIAWTSIERNSVKRILIPQNGMCAGEQVRFHPTQKPVALMAQCLSHAPEAKTVFDPWMGSGTTLVAAKLRGLQATGIEREESYCEIAAKRLQQEVLAL